MKGLTRQELALIAVTMVWGGTFLVIQIAMRHSGPLAFVAARFLVAALVTGALFSSDLRGMSGRDGIAGLAIGVTIFLGYSLQTWGLKSLSSSESAFITAMYVPIVPLLEWCVFSRLPRLWSWIGIFLAFAGLLLLANPDPTSLHLSPSALATLIATVPIAAEVVLIGWFAGRVNSRNVTVIQVLTAGGLALIALPVAGESLPDLSLTWIACAAGLGVASGVIQLTMNWAQRSLSPTRATVIYAGEPVWGGLTGRLAGDRLGPVAHFGALLILAGILLSHLGPPERKAE